MYKGKNILAVVPARGGSKGIKLKNLKKIGGKTLIYHTAQIINSIKEIDAGIVSTDSLLIKKEALKNNLLVPFLRPEKISGDFIGDLEVLEHALTSMEIINKCKYDVILMLQPTAPFRRKIDVIKTIKKLIDENLDSVWTVSKLDKKFHPLKQLYINDNGYLNLFDKRGKNIIARQQLGEIYYRNGIAYAISRNTILIKKSILGEFSKKILIKYPNINIDTMEDLNLANEIFLNKKKSRG